MNNGLMDLENCSGETSSKLWRILRWKNDFLRRRADPQNVKNRSFFPEL
jgi:hypothetical protein